MLDRSPHSFTKLATKLNYNVPTANLETSSSKVGVGFDNRESLNLRQNSILNRCVASSHIKSDNLADSNDSMEGSIDIRFTNNPFVNLVEVPMIDVRNYIL